MNFGGWVCFISVVIAIPGTCLGALMQPLGDAKLGGWSGLGLTANDETATLSVPGEAVFRYPDGPRGWYKHGFRIENDSTADWRDFYGVRLQVHLSDDQPVELQALICPTDRTQGDVGASVVVRGSGWHSVTLPWSAFAAEQARTAYLRFVKELRLKARFSGNQKTGRIEIKNVRLIKAPVVSLQAEVRGKSVPTGGNVEYQVTVGNCTDEPQSARLSFMHYGWTAMTASAEPSELWLAPGESKPCIVRVSVPSSIPAGGHENQVLQAIANGNASAAGTLTFVTAAALPHPNILHTADRWREVREKARKYDWAKAAQDDYVRRAERWNVPEVARPPNNDPDDTMGPFLFRTPNENDLMACGIAWQLTGNKQYAEKAAEFLRRLSDPNEGYPKTLRACNQSLVQEGHFFQHVAMVYDMILDADVLSESDRQQIERMFRMLMETLNQASLNGPINNWNLSEMCGALYCALALQDLAAAERFFSGPAGVVDQLAKGTMDDGWWYECSISYNVWCASEFSQVALAMQPWGINFRDMWVPANYSPKVMLSSELSGGRGGAGTDRPFGMCNEIWGPIHRPYRQITDLWNSLLPFLDYRGVMFGVNDSTENRVSGNRTEVGGQPFEIAYFLFRDPAYAAVIKRGDGKRDLLYGVPELPAETPEQFRNSAFADNVGLVMLRSQTENRPIREQIQAVLHYGTHGWAHGHFDRTDLLSLMRYGRSFYNPEMVWYGYEPFMYKFYTQTSIAHNMVVVDRKMQEASPGNRLLFHTGKLMQAAAVETTTRWSNPPYGGMVYDYVPVKTFEEKTWREGRYVPIPTNAPQYGTLTDFTEPILQRRLLVVTDDYVVLADYVKGTRPHVFESLLQMKGFRGLEAPGKKFLRHDAQWNPDPVGGAQFVTDCDWYSANAPAVSRFEMRWGPGADNEGTRALASENGVLKLDVHTLWPKSQEIMIGTVPEDHEVEKRLFYTVRGDGKVLSEGRFGAWILGKADIDVSVAGVKQLELETKVELSRKPTVFWANARIVMADGKEIPLSEFAPTFVNVEQPKQSGQDYFGGPIKIVGTEYKTATPGQPADGKQPAFVRVDLSGRGAARFKATLGSDYPPGDESQRRKAYAIRINGTEARLLTVIEPYENSPVIGSAEATSADRLRVELADGRIQEINIHDLDGNDVSVDVTESKDGRVVRTEDSAEDHP